ncbi:MAG: hypothetical protein JST48_14490 [Bacteroidetes bacterium]|nr:hypothetical protein [Bacteroidota bacterium]
MMQIELEKIPLLLRDALITILFGLLSGILSKVEFQIPGIVNSDLREIPFLIALLYIRNPIFIFALALSAFIGAPADMPIWAVYVTHLVPLFVGFFSYKLLEGSGISSVMMGIAWIPITVVYYLAALLPLVVMSVSLTPSLTPPGNPKDFWDVYLSGLPTFRYEIITSSLVTGLYLVQMRARKKLEDTNKNLQKYAFMNSHELRAPLARMLGLLQLLKLEKDPEQTKILLNLLQETSIELDKVIRQMNRLLEKEIF